MKIKHTKLTESFSIVDIFPDKDQIKYIVDSFIKYEPNKSNSEWCKKNFMSTPWGIAWNVSPKGRKPSVQTAIKYFLVAILCQWTDLIEQLKRTLNKTYKIDKSGFSDIGKEWDGNILEIANEVKRLLDEAKAVTAPESDEKSETAKDESGTAVDETEDTEEDLEYVATFTRKLVPHFGRPVNEDLLDGIRYMIDNTPIVKVSLGMMLYDKLSAAHDALGTVSLKWYTKTMYDFAGYADILNSNGSDSTEEECADFFVAFANVLTAASIWQCYKSRDEAVKLFDDTVKLLLEYDCISKNKIELASRIHDIGVLVDIKTKVNKLIKSGSVFKSADIDLIESINFDEDIEKHEELNPVLWEDNKLKAEVKEKIEAIVDEFVSGLAEDDINLSVSDIVIIGSNCSYNYTKDSDLDIHIVADAADMLTNKLYSAYRSLFNKKFDIDFYNIPVEIFVDTENTPTVSNGIYSVMNDAWIKEPVIEDIPELNQEEFDKVFKEWEDKYNKIIKDNELNESQSQEIDGTYKMLSKEYDVDLVDLVYGPNGFMKTCYPDGFPDFAGDVIYSEKYWDEMIEWAIEHHRIDPNIIAANKANDFVIEDLELKENAIIGKIDNDALKIAEDKLAELDKKYKQEHPKSYGITIANIYGVLQHIIIPLIKHTYPKLAKADIIKTLKQIPIIKNYVKFDAIDWQDALHEDFEDAKSIVADQIRGEWEAIKNYEKASNDLKVLGNDFDNVIDILNDIADEEEVHVGELQKAQDLLDDNVLDNINDGEEEAEEKLSAEKEFPMDENWSDIIDFSVGDYIIHDTPDYATKKPYIIATEPSKEDGYWFYKACDEERLAHWIADDVDGIVVDNKAVREALNEKVSNSKLDEINDYIESIYQLRKDALAKDGEYSIGNLVFKELRNKGYLDNLKELKNKVISKELSLEEVENTDEDAEELTETYTRLSGKEIYEYRIKLQQIARIQPIVQENGRFDFYNVRDCDADAIIAKLRREPFIEFVQKTAGKFDFNHIKFSTLPSRYYNIYGKIKL